jgi:hypothetical protein
MQEILGWKETKAKGRIREWCDEITVGNAAAANLSSVPRPSLHVKKCCFPRAESPFCRALLSFYRNPPASPVPHPRVGGTTSPGLSLNRSQYGGCSTKYNTPAGTQVVCRRFEGEQAVFPESSQNRTQARAVA